MWNSLGHLLQQQASRIGSQELLRFEGQRITFEQLEQRTNQLANVLKARGISKGDKVAVMLPNGLEFPTAWLAIAKLGAVIVPVNVHYQVSDLAYVLNDSDAKYVLAGPDQVPILVQVNEACAGVERIWGLGTGASTAQGVIDLIPEMEGASNVFDVGHVNGEDLVNIQYTSGTTGFPKGCMLTHDYWLGLAEIARDYAGIRRDDVDLTTQPFYYMDPQWNMVMCMIAGIPLVVLPRFSASTFWKSAKEYGVTFFYVLGTMPVYLLKQPENPDVERDHKVRLVICSGIVPQLHSTYEARWGCPWREAFGMTETGVDLLMPIEDVGSVGSGAMGKVVSSKEARVVDEDGQEVHVGQVGELVVRGKPMMRGYYKNPDATSHTIRDGWLHTGDLVKMDEKGYFYIVGRLKDMIRRSGENISSAEVEGALCEHPSVRAVAVVPVADELRGEEVKAFVQLREGEDSKTAPPRDFIEFLRDRLAPFKVPRFIEYRDDFPRTPSERIEKHKLMQSKSDQRAGTYDASVQKWIENDEMD